MKNKLVSFTSKVHLKPQVKSYVVFVIMNHLMTMLLHGKWKSASSKYADMVESADMNLDGMCQILHEISLYKELQ